MAEHYNPDEPEFTPELFGYNTFGRTGREWNFFPVDEMIYQEYSDRQDTTLDYLPSYYVSTLLVFPRELARLGDFSITKYKR